VKVKLPGVVVTVYVGEPVPAEPGVKGTSIALSTFWTITAVPIVGAVGALPAVTEPVEPEVAEPNKFDAVTVNVYAVPAVRPVTRIGLEPVAVIPPGDEVAVNVVTPVPAAPAV
jgi:hypothetical protein